MKLLIVDDERNIRLLMHKTLARLDLGLKEIFVASNGLEALELVREQSPDIIITDIVMPWLSGHELVGEIQKINPDCVFILISGHDDIAFYQQAINLQVFRYLLKPIQIAKLVDTIQLAVKESAKRKAVTLEGIYQELFLMMNNEPVMSEIREKHSAILTNKRSLIEHNIENMVIQTSALFLSLIDKLTLLSQNNAFSLIASGTIFECKNYKDLMKACDTIYSKLEPLTGENTITRHQTVVLNVLRFVEENYTRNIGAREIAEHCGISPGYLSTIFSQTSHGSIPQYITDFRLEKAMGFLVEGQMSISEIALNCGFSSANYFSKVFRNKYGYSPSDVREGISL